MVGGAADLERCHYVAEGSPAEGCWMEGVFSRARQIAEKEKEGMVSLEQGTSIPNDSRRLNSRIKSIMLM